MNNLPKINKGMLAAFVAMLTLIAVSFGIMLVFTILLIITAIVFNALVSLEAIACLKEGRAFDQQHKAFLGAALALNIIAFFTGSLTLVVAAGIGAPLLINVAIYIEDKVRGKK